MTLEGDMNGGGETWEPPCLLLSRPCTLPRLFFTNTDPHWSLTVKKETNVLACLIDFLTELQKQAGHFWYYVEKLYACDIKVSSSEKNIWTRFKEAIGLLCQMTEFKNSKVQCRPKVRDYSFISVKWQVSVYCYLFGSI